MISHPDAGKSTLTEALALHARVISEAGAIHGKAGRKSTVSDWMDMEKARGISISSAALQFGYGDAVVLATWHPIHVMRFGAADVPQWKDDLDAFRQRI